MKTGDENNMNDKTDNNFDGMKNQNIQSINRVRVRIKYEIKIGIYPEYFANLGRVDNSFIKNRLLRFVSRSSVNFTIGGQSEHGLEAEGHMKGSSFELFISDRKSVVSGT